jgi:hypothetical protein
MAELRQLLDGEQNGCIAANMVENGKTGVWLYLL